MAGGMVEQDQLQRDMAALQETCSPPSRLPNPSTSPFWDLVVMKSMLKRG